MGIQTSSRDKLWTSCPTESARGGGRQGQLCACVCGCGWVGFANRTCDFAQLAFKSRRRGRWVVAESIAGHSPIHFSRLLRMSFLQVYGGERVVAMLGLPPAPAARHEYSSKEVTLEVVGDMQEAIDHIHMNGSGHTEVIITGDATGECACVWSHLPEGSGSVSLRRLPLSCSTVGLQQPNKEQYWTVYLLQCPCFPPRMHPARATISQLLKVAHSFVIPSSPSSLLTLQLRPPSWQM